MKINHFLHSGAKTGEKFNKIYGKYKKVAQTDTITLKLQNNFVRKIIILIDFTQPFRKTAVSCFSKVIKKIRYFFFGP